MAIILYNFFEPKKAENIFEPIEIRFYSLILPIQENHVGKHHYSNVAMYFLNPFIDIFLIPAHGLAFVISILNMTVSLMNALYKWSLMQSEEPTIYNKKANKELAQAKFHFYNSLAALLGMSAHPIFSIISIFTRPVFSIIHAVFEYRENRELKRTDMRVI